MQPTFGVVKLRLLIKSGNKTRLSGCKTCVNLSYGTYANRCVLLRSLRRDAAYAFQFYASTPNFSPPYPQSDIDFVQGFKNSITSQMPGVTFYGYANYVDATLSASEA